jgi:hypothetical protein
MAEDWESGHFMVVSPDMVSGRVTVSSSMPLTETELSRLVVPYGKMTAIERTGSVVGYSYRVTIDPHPEALAQFRETRG